MINSNNNKNNNHINNYNSRVAYTPKSLRLEPSLYGYITSPNIILANRKQRNNPIVGYLRNCRIQYVDMTMECPDFITGPQHCVVYVSIEYHLLYPDYIIRRLQQMYVVLLVHVNVDDPTQAIIELNKIALENNLTLLLAWSNRESIRYIETLKLYHSKSPDVIKEKLHDDYESRSVDILTNIQGVNKTDVGTLLTTYGSMKKLITTSRDKLSICPGIGIKKQTRLYEAFRKPFRIKENYNNMINDNDLDDDNENNNNNNEIKEDI